MPYKSERDIAYYHANKEYYKKKNDLRRQARREYLHEILGQECVACGSTEKIEFDHIDVSKKLHRTSPLAMGITKLAEEAKNLRPLCHKCHVKHSTAQKKAAWHLFCELPLSEQERLSSLFMDIPGKPKAQNVL